MWFGLANEQMFHQFAMFNILGTLYTKLYNQRIMADQQGLRLVTAILRMEQCGHRMKTLGEPPCIKKKSGGAAQVGLQVGGQGGGPEARESARDTALAGGRPAESRRSRRTTVRGRTRDSREGREERGERRETRGRSAHLAWPGTAKGHAPTGRWDRRRAPGGAVTR